MSEQSTKNLVPFAKGSDVRRGRGRPAGIVDRIRELTRDGADLIAVFVCVVSDPGSTPKEKMDAAAWLADRGWGKAPIAIAVATGAAGDFSSSAHYDDPTELHRRIRTMNDEELALAMARLNEDEESQGRCPHCGAVRLDANVIDVEASPITPPPVPSRVDVTEPNDAPGVATSSGVTSTLECTGTIELEPGECTHGAPLVPDAAGWSGCALCSASLPPAPKRGPGRPKGARNKRRSP